MLVSSKNIEVVKDLTIYSEVVSDYPGPKPKIVAFRRIGDQFLVPKHYGIKKFGGYVEKDTHETVNLGFNGTLRGYQTDVITKTLDHFAGDHFARDHFSKDTLSTGGIWSIGTGMGKTVMLLNLIHRLNVKTLIILHKQILLDQWRDRIREYIPDARVGVIQGSVIDIEDKDIVLSMMQSLTRKEYDSNLFDSFGMMVIDEVHCVCAQTFSEVLFMVNTKYKIGLSATPKRKDGFDKILLYHIGPTIVNLHNSSVKPVIYVEYSKRMNDVSVTTNSLGKVNLPALITDISKNRQRNEFIIDILCDKLREKRKIIVFSDRVAQCETLCKMLRSKLSSGDKTCDKFIGKMKKTELDKALDTDCIFATYGIAKEGFDCPQLDTLLFATPKTDVVQAVGRILRQHNACEPHVIDIVDKQFQVFVGSYYNRKKFYRDFTIIDSSKISSKIVPAKCMIKTEE